MEKSSERIDVDFEELMDEVREGIQLAKEQKTKNPSGKDQLEELKRSESEASMAGIGDSLRKFHFSAKKGLETLGTTNPRVRLWPADICLT